MAVVADQDLFTRFAKARVIEVLRTFFTQLPDDKLRWNEDDKLTNLYINDKYTINLENVEMKPAIIVDRGDLSWMHRNIGQYRGEVGLGSPGRVTDVVATDITCRCISVEGIEAEMLADFVAVCFIGFRRVIKESIKRMIDVKVFRIGTEILAKSDSGKDVSIVPVGLRIWHDFVFNVTDKDEQEWTKFVIDIKTSLQTVKC